MPDLDLTPLEDLPDAGQVRLAVGRPLHGPEAFRLSHLQAEAALRVGRRAGRRADHSAVHSYDQVELVSLIGDDELMNDTARRELGELLPDTETNRTLRDTALAYLRSGQHVDRTAETLFIHPNTVRYRIGNIERKLGHRITDHAAALEHSLRWIEVFG